MSSHIKVHQINTHGIKSIIHLLLLHLHDVLNLCRYGGVMHQVQSPFLPITSNQVFFGDKSSADIVMCVRYSTVENTVAVKAIECGTSYQYTSRSASPSNKLAYLQSSSKKLSKHFNGSIKLL